MSISACIISVSGPVLLEEERAFLRQVQPWGVILMGRSCQSRAQVKALVSSIHSELGREALIFIDQEGGRVARLKAPEWPIFPAAGDYGSLYELDPVRALAACKLGHLLLATELFDLGIRANCAPDLDLRQAITTDAIGDRAFGFDPETVIDLGQAALQGLSEGGVVGCLKHLPGHGRATVDSHYEFPRVSASLDELEQDFSIFRALAKPAAMGMTAHIAFDALAPDEAATVSQTVISDTIRGRIGFDGLLMTDDLGMDALGGTLQSRGERAIEAGVDVLLHCAGFKKDPAQILSEMEEIARAAPVLDGISGERAERAVQAVIPPNVFDREEAWDNFKELMKPVTGAVFS